MLRNLTAAAAALCGAVIPAIAAEAGDLVSCSTLNAPAERLACYDRIAGRIEAPAKAQGAAPVDIAPAPARGPTPAGEGLQQAPSSFLSRFWELGADDKRGTFNLTGYRPNYFLPAHWTTHMNTTPSSPTRGVVNTPDYQRIEAKFQISLRTKLLENVGLPGGDLWAAYSQVSLWQVWNRADSSPFRATDYEPELIYVAPVPERWSSLPFGWKWKFGQLGIKHQSNGQADPLSRSWNRVYLGTAFEHEDVSLVAHFYRRLSESASQDDNPDINDTVGRSDFLLAWTPGLATASVTYKSTLRSFTRGSIQFDWTYPVDRQQPNGLRWYAQAFSGYGETLTDYNFRQTSVGVGLTLFNF